MVHCVVVSIWTVWNSVVEVSGGMQRRLVLAVEVCTTQGAASTACADRVDDHRTDRQKHDHQHQHHRNDDAERHVVRVLVIGICKPHRQWSTQTAVLTNVLPSLGRFPGLPELAVSHTVLFLCLFLKARFTRYNLLSIRLSNRLYHVYKHSTYCQIRLTTGLTNGCIVYTVLFVQHGCQTGCQTRLTMTTGCIVYTNIKPVWQPVGCLFTRYSPLSNPLYNRCDNRLYRVNGV